ncbi:WhiB family redox-sensing transcriptional regulator [Mumia flava]|uniref:Transcriptional regulator WhiB n=1 Tax=Mumia flava TaxID=1348852 RepID=A0A0B2BJP4_9ACTN|nr:WhiB family transcriptional regulator [Mumia flava]PJJ57342.1 WhiB family redox-sensing transcriptional regulator [Mumia flava]
MSTISRLPAPILDSYEWQFDAACSGVDTEEFFSPEDERGAARAEREARAKTFCAGCPVVQQCLEHAIKVREPYGVWGGLNPRERQLYARGQRDVVRIGETEADPAQHTPAA